MVSPQIIGPIHVVSLKSKLSSVFSSDVAAGCCYISPGLSFTFYISCVNILAVKFSEAHGFSARSCTLALMTGNSFLVKLLFKLGCNVSVMGAAEGTIFTITD